MTGILLFWIVLLFAACSSDGKRSIPIHDSFRFSSFVQMDDEAKKVDSFVASVVNAQGFREPVNDFSFDKTSGRFSFILDKSRLSKRLGATLPEIFAYMGANYQGSDRPIAGLFGDSDSGFLRLELFPANALSVPGVLASYLQIAISVPLVASWQVSREIPIATADGKPFSFYKVGRVKVITKDAAGSLISGAAVTGVPLYPDANHPLGKSEPYVGVRESSYAPVFVTSSSTGEAVVMPVRIDGVDPKFQVAAILERKCPVVSSQTSYTPSAPQTIPLSMESCDAVTQSLETIRWNAVADTALNRDAADVVKTREKSMIVKVSAQSLQVRGMNVRVYASESAEGQADQAQEFPVFSSELLINLPSKEGRFTVVLESRFSAEDVARFGAPPTQTIKGIRSTVVPTVSEARFTVTSPTGVSNVVSGTGAPFILKYSRCSSGEQIAMRLASTVTVTTVPEFTKCDPNGNSFTFSSLQVATPPTEGGEYNVVFYLKDAYGNIGNTLSESRPIYFDFGNPTQADCDTRLGIDFGFALKGSRVGTDVDPWLFAATQLKATNLSDYVFRFGSPSACKAVPPTSADGPVETDARGYRYEKYFLSQPTTLESALSSAAACSEDLAISSSIVSFPADSAGDATFRLGVMDPAGHFSDIMSCSIRPCSVGGFHVCWSPN